MRAIADRVRPTVYRLAVEVRTLPMRLRQEAGQTVAEYALVLLVAAAVAGVFLLWAKQSGKLDAFFDAVFEKLLGSVDEPSPTPAP